MNYIVVGGRYCSGEVAKAIRRGLLKHPREFFCADCGGQAIEYDHRDYNKPLCVEPVCRRCNLRRGPATPKQWSDGELITALRQQPVFQIKPDSQHWLYLIEKRCAEVAALTGGRISHHDIRPDLFSRSGLLASWDDMPADRRPVEAKAA